MMASRWLAWDTQIPNPPDHPVQPDAGVRTCGRQIWRRIDSSSTSMSAARGSLMGKASNSSDDARRRLARNLAERVRELTALHAATRLLAESAAPLDVFRRFVALLPPAWRYPEITAGRIAAGEINVCTDNFRRTPWRQQAEFPMPGGHTGTIEIVYLEKRHEQAEGPFLAEERSLLESLAKLLSAYLYRIHAGAERAPLTEAEAACRDAQQTNVAKDQFLATLSHELRTQLNVMLGWTAALRAHHLDSTRASRGLQVLEHSARMQADLIDDLLDVSRIVTGQLRVNLRPLLFSEVVTLAIDAARPAADGNGIRLRAAILPDVRVRGDATRLQQVIANLLANALKFTRAGGRIDVTLEREGADACLVVRDDGIGIPAHVLPRIFHRFAQLDQSATGTSAGLGLGLAIVKELVERHGGRISAASQGPALGATFTVTLPLIDERDSAS
jgi:signal transduction histidine kinase